MRCTPLRPLAVGKTYKLPLFTLFRPLCPAFSFADVDTYDIVRLIYQRQKKKKAIAKEECI